MVKDFTVILGITVVGRVTTNFTTAHSVGLHRVGVFEPVDDVKVVNMLLGDVITAKPIEVIPIAHLILKFTFDPPDDRESKRHHRSRRRACKVYLQ